MAVGCGPKVAKFVLFVFNVLFWLTGVVLIVLAAVYLADQTIPNLDRVINNNTSKQILVGLLIIGIIVFVIGFCGCLGAIKESRFLLGLYIVLVVLIIIVEAAFGIFAAVQKNVIIGMVSTQLNDTMMNKYGGEDVTINAAIDQMQKRLQCCGVQNYTDWIDSVFYKNNTLLMRRKVPSSCCIEPGCERNTPTATTYQTGCVQKMEEFLKTCFPIVIGIALGIALFEIFVVICAVCLCRNTETQRQAV